MFGRGDYWRCILTKYKLLNDEDKLVHDKYYSHLDNWASLNPEFTNVITTAKMFCLDIYRYKMPIGIDGFFEFQNCIRNYVNLDCPVIIQSKECFEWKEFYDECREFYI
nr:uncharacterized protein LOC117986407 [Maniola hyperantus]